MQADVTTIVRKEEPRSYCPINLALEIFGDRWTLLIIRDMMFGGKRHFREMLQSHEQIASNILADRLKMLLQHGMVTKADDPSHKQKAVYSLTEKGIALVPVFVQIAAWGRRFLPASKEPGVHAQKFEAGGPATWNRFMAELREAHLGVRAGGPKSHAASVAGTLRRAAVSRPRRARRR